jgi:hypothetical protein
VVTNVSKENTAFIFKVEVCQDGTVKYLYRRRMETVNEEKRRLERGRWMRGPEMSRS